MPNGNGTGPVGAGPMTGRGMGYCAGYVESGYAGPIGRRGIGRGLGLGRGRGRGFGRQNTVANNLTATGPVSPGVPVAQELEALKGQVEILQKRIDELQNNDE